MIDNGDTISIGQIRHALVSAKKKQKTAIYGATNGVRYVHWNTKTQHYKCIKQGNKVFDSEADIQEAFTQKRLHADMFYIYQNTRSGAERNRTVPLYEAVYAIGTYHVKVQQKHLKQGYRNANKTDRMQAWNVSPEGTRLS